MTDITAIEELTPREFRLLSIGHSLRELDELEELHLAAWLGVVVDSTEGSGKNRRRKYKRFGQFFDKEKAEAEIRKQTTIGRGETAARASRLARLAEYHNSKKGGENNG